MRNDVLLIIDGNPIAVGMDSEEAQRLERAWDKDGASGRFYCSVHWVASLNSTYTGPARGLSKTTMMIDLQKLSGLFIEFKVG